MESQTATLIARLYEAFDDGKFEGVEELFTHDFVDHELPPGTPPGPEGMMAFIRMTREAFPDQVHEIKDVFAAGDRIAWRLEWRGTHRGQFFGIPPTGKPFLQKQVHIVRIADGKAAEHWACRDDLGMTYQLGLIPTHPFRRTE